MQGFSLHISSCTFLEDFDTVRLMLKYRLNLSTYGHTRTKSQINSQISKAIAEKTVPKIALFFLNFNLILLTPKIKPKSEKKIKHLLKISNIETRGTEKRELKNLVIGRKNKLLSKLTIPNMRERTGKYFFIIN